MSENFASCSMSVNQSSAKAIPTLHQQVNEGRNNWRRIEHPDAVALSLPRDSDIRAMSSLKGKERQSNPSYYPSALHSPGLHPSQDSLALLVRAAEVQVEPPFNRARTSTSMRRSLSASKERMAFCPDLDLCNQCVAAPFCPLGDSTTAEECCTAPCSIVCSAALSPQALESPCSASALACCESSEYMLDVSPTIIACQGAECVDAAAIICNDAECVAPVENFKMKSADCPSTCNISATLPIEDNCPACDDGVTRSYSSFQELLDCWCCSDSELTPCNGNDGGACTIPYDACCFDSTLPPTNVNLHASVAGSSSSFTRSRHTSMGTSTRQSPSLSSHGSSETSSQYWSKLEANRARENRRIENQYMKCLFEGEHRHNDQGMCLPPVMTTNNHLYSRPDNFTNYYVSPAIPAPQLHTCHWGGCGLQCSSVTELASHVNAVHLATIAPAPQAVTSNSTSDEQASSMTWDQQDHALKCLWDSCQSQGEAPGAFWQDENLILEHILQAHVGVDETFQSASSSALKRKYETEDKISRSESSSSIQDAVDEKHLCRWKGCSEVFTTHEDLTTHITQDHVGGGKAQYTCQWQGCTRGDRTFYQKQKILRHLQTHTGYRPYVCDTCEKRFSEPSTLAQHQRTHTKEKPYSCDHPGCGKSFSVAASLTIHKRVHTGEKPFKCKWPDCSLAFSESSNLRKHMRIHTGEKPFICTQEGCSKSFSRPDQLARHRKTHLKMERKE